MADQEVFGTVLSVQGRSGTSKAGNAYTIYEVQLSDGNTYKTFKNEVGTPANEFQKTGTPIKAQVHQESRPDGKGGTYPPELYIDSIELATPVIPGVDVPQEPQIPTAQQFLPPITDNGAPPPIRNKDDEIRAMWAIGRAVKYVTHNGSGAVESDMGQIMDLAREFYFAALDGPEKAAQNVTEEVTKTW